MLIRILTTLTDFGSAMYDAFALPGTVILSLLATYAPGIAAWLNIENAQAPPHVAILLSLVFWLLVVFFVVRLGRIITRYVGALVRTGLYQASQVLAGVRTTTILRLRALFPRRRRTDEEDIPMVRFDSLDMAVLRSMSAKGPGFALSAPDLAGPFKLRPSQVQRILDKLCKHKMLVGVIGSTDGYENYRLTDYGEAYLAMCQRQDRFRPAT